MIIYALIHRFALPSPSREYRAVKIYAMTAGRPQRGERMLAVLKAAQQGVDLEMGPFPTPTLPLEEALAKLEQLQGELP